MAAVADLCERTLHRESTRPRPATCRQPAEGHERFLEELFEFRASSGAMEILDDDRVTRRQLVSGGSVDVPAL